MLVAPKDTKRAPGRGSSQHQQLRSHNGTHTAHKKAQTRRSHHSPLPSEQRSRVAVVHVIVITRLVFRRAMEVDLLLEYVRTTVTMPQVRERRLFVALGAWFNEIIGIRIHGAAGACWTNIAHLSIGGTSRSSAGSTPLVREIVVLLVLQELLHSCVSPARGAITVPERREFNRRIRCPCWWGCQRSDSFSFAKGSDLRLTLLGFCKVRCICREASASSEAPFLILNLAARRM